jgi:V8-like Glu-specific endopeptidase
MSNIITSRLLLLVVVASAVTSGAAQLLGGAPICETLVPYSYDSGLITTNNSNNSNATSSSAALSSRTKKVVISYPNASYIQLDLSATHLANDDKLVLRSVNGHGDGPVTTQIVTRDALKYASNGYSAIFMGNSISIKLVEQQHSPSPRLHSNEGATLASSSSSSRVIISNILVGGLCGSNEDNSNNINNSSNHININKISGDGGSDNNDVITPFSICGTSDGRLPSSDIRQGRISLGGSCTAFMISKSIFVTAGHCGNATSNSRLKFTFNGTDTPVVPENQYAIELSTYKKVYESGVDWAAGRILPNAVTGNYPTSWYSIDTSLPLVGKTVRVTGYGTDNYDNTDTNGGGLNITCRLCQQTHLGKITDTVSGAIRHNVDTMAGDSGAPLILESSGKVVAIHTNGGCSAGSSSFNVAKRFTQEFLNHINDLQGRPTTKLPTFTPTTNKPTSRPSMIPTNNPSMKPSTLRPTTAVPTTLQPTDIPTHSPTTTSPISSSSATTSTPTTSTPSSKPSLSPTTPTPTTSSPSSNKPSLTPTMVIPTSLPTTRVPTFKPAKPVKTSLPTSLKPTSANPTTRTPSSSKPTSWKPTTSSPTFGSVKLTTPLCTTAGNITSRKCFRQNGNMFSLDAKVNVTILSISVYSLSTATGIAAEVWTKSGNYSGYELNSTAWTKVGGKSKMCYLLDGIYCTHTLPHTHTE